MIPWSATVNGFMYAMQRRTTTRMIKKRNVVMDDRMPFVSVTASGRFSSSRMA